MITLSGKDETEVAVCLFERGILSRYGFFPKEENEKITSDMLEIVTQVPETFYILRQFIHLFDPAQIRVLEAVEGGF